MNHFLIALLFAVTAMPVPVGRVADDAKTIDRVAAASRHDLPADLLRRIVNEDIELLRGPRSDQTYEHAGYERFESGRITEGFSVQSREQKLEVRGSFVYRLIIDMPSRRMVVTRNRRVYIERIDIEAVSLQGGPSRMQTTKIESWFTPGMSRTIDFDDIARQATVRVYAHSDKDEGYGNVILSLAQARVFDNPNSPYADAVASAKAILRGLDHGDVPSIRAMATRMLNDLQPASVGPSSAGRPAETTSTEAGLHSEEFYTELQAIEDLLTGTEAERRQGLDRLHQLVRKVRAQPR
jgi:hypothetical protein